jgi:hypothetical protein
VAAGGLRFLWETLSVLVSVCRPSDRDYLVMIRQTSGGGGLGAGICYLSLYIFMLRHPHVSLQVPPELRRPLEPLAQVPWPGVPCPLAPFGLVLAGSPTLKRKYYWY